MRGSPRARRRASRAQAPSPPARPRTKSSDTRCRPRRAETAACGCSVEWGERPVRSWGSHVLQGAGRARVRQRNLTKKSNRNSDFEKAGSGKKQRLLEEEAGPEPILQDANQIQSRIREIIRSQQISFRKLYANELPKPDDTEKIFMATFPDFEVGDLCPAYYVLRNGGAHFVMPNDEQFGTEKDRDLLEEEIA